MNSDESTPTQDTSPTAPPICSLPQSFKDAPLEVLLSEEMEGLLHTLSNEQLVEYVKRCNLLRSSAQTMNAQLRKESVEVHGAEPKTRKKKNETDLDKAMKALGLL